MDDIYSDYADVQGKQVVYGDMKDSDDEDDESDYATAYRLVPNEDQYINFSDEYDTAEPEISEGEDEEEEKMNYSVALEKQQDVHEPTIKDEAVVALRHENET
eukprot:TRINITY_DN4373_c0_g1_i1.p1 TRINITY_DN4373_c0_g1~~TRINITY_DN4373_c0_g1_i1.p1  ORF type:complete len:103 (-),score=27.92 TRINITY_DN4373_c0_g1_i1:273-581(-)